MQHTKKKDKENCENHPFQDKLKTNQDATEVQRQKEI